MNQIFQINLSIFLRYRIKRKIVQEIVRSYIHIYIYIYKSKLEFEGEYYHTSRDYKNPRCDITEGWRKSVVIFSIDASSLPLPLPISFCSLCYAYLARHTASGVITRKGYMNASERSVEKLYARNLSLLEPPEPRTSSRSRLLLPSNDPLFARKIRYLNFEPEEF